MQVKIERRPPAKEPIQTIVFGGGRGAHNVIFSRVGENCFWVDIAKHSMAVTRLELLQIGDALREMATE